ncbi:MAG: galactokinase, partial [Bulleidia sp.]|nr:galactokinase [Bulleidia sp.]
IATFLKLVKESGQSSYMYLQNVLNPTDHQNQALGVALALSQMVLKDDGAYRVHGGGFAGTIQAYVPVKKVQEYIQTMESSFGKDCCYILRIRPCGGVKVI